MRFVWRSSTRKIIIHDVTKEKLIDWFSLGRHRPLVWTNGVFDIVHTGHLGLLKFCKRIPQEEDSNGHMEYLTGTVVVGVNSDESTKSLDKSHELINNEIDRAKMVISLKGVDFAVIFDEPDPINCLKIIKPDYYVKGGDYTIDTINQDERKIVEGYGGEVLISPHIEGKSTSNVYDEIYQRGYGEGYIKGHEVWIR